MADKIYKWVGFDSNHPLNTADKFIAGMECEIEDVRVEMSKIGIFHATEDGSLRNHGVEWISDPCSLEVLVDGFTHLHSTLKFRGEGDPFSARTSTHVHVNCRSLDMQQARQMVLLYALFEEIFFVVVDQHRRSNIHCVPLTETYLPTKYGHDIANLVGVWHKYTALNLLPLVKLGTIEFRHLQGTNDVKLVTEWLTLLSNLWKECQITTLTVENISNQTFIMGIFDRLFGHIPRAMVLRNAVPNIISNSLLDVKFSFI